MAYLVGIAGGSGSGKGTIADLIQKHLVHWGLKCFILSTDDCYKDLSHLGTTERDELCFNLDFNFDHPRVVDFDKLLTYGLRLKDGQKFEYPEYDFKVHKYGEGRVAVPVGLDVAIIEGIYALYSGTEVGVNPNELVSLYDRRLFVVTTPEVALIRRIRRDIQERGRPVDHALRQLEKTVVPMYHRFIYPTSLNADDVIDWKADARGEDSVKRTLIMTARQKALSLYEAVKGHLVQELARAEAKSL